MRNISNRKQVRRFFECIAVYAQSKFFCMRPSFL